MIMKANKQIGFIYKDNESIDRILKDGDVVFERGFLREKTSTTLPITFGGVGKDLKDYKIYGNTVQNGEPTPDAPIDMVSCGDRTKNLFDVTKPYISENLSAAGVTLTFNDDGTITANGTNNASYKYIRFDISLEAGTYYFSGCPSGGSNNGYSIIVQTGSGSSSQIFDTGEGATFTLTEKKTIQFFPVRIGSSTVTFNNMVFKPIIAKVPVTYANYEPYGYKIPVNVRSDNLFDKSNANIITGYIGNNAISTSNQSRTLYIQCKPNTTYTISKILSKRFAVGTTTNEPTLGETVSNQTQLNNATNITITTNSNANYLCVFFFHSNYDTLTEQQILDSIMIVEGSTAPSKYIPYYNKTTNIYLDEPLRKIDGYSDYIDFINGKVVRRIKETLLDDNITWITGRFAIEKRIYTLSSNIDSNMRAVTSNSQVGYLLSNQYKAEKLENILALSVRNGIGISSTSYFSILNKDYASAIDFLQALHDNPIVLDYVLRTPTEESITLPNIPTVDGNNKLNIETEITPSQVYIKYKSNN